MAMSDMTLGQYIPADSLMHRMDARVKILLGPGFYGACVFGEYGAGLREWFLCC